MRYIVTMTSFGERLKSESHLAISSILNNKVLPDKIYVVVNYCDSNNVPELFNTCPLIEIIYTNEDLKSHNKYYHTALLYPEDVIITIDDDVEYPDTFIEDCIRSYKLYPNAINAGRVHRIK
jgi:choline kinase